MKNNDEYNILSAIEEIQYSMDNNDFDMRNFLINMFARKISIIKLDIDHVYGHFNKAQHELYCFNDHHHGGVPKHKGIYFAKISSTGVKSSYDWESISDTIHEYLRNIIYWLEFSKNTDIDISIYVYYLTKRERALLNLIVENRDKILNVDDSKEEGD